jgi:hypothetical protein
LIRELALPRLVLLLAILLIDYKVLAIVEELTVIEVCVVRLASLRNVIRVDLAYLAVIAAVVVLGGRLFRLWLHLLLCHILHSEVTFLLALGRVLLSLPPYSVFDPIGKAVLLICERSARPHIDHLSPLLELL